MALLTKLNAKHEASIPAWRADWEGVAKATGPCPLSPAQLTDLLRRVYEAGGLPAPKEVILVPSPKAALVKYNTLIGTPPGARLKYPDFCYGNHDASWLAFYQFFSKQCGVDTKMKLDPLEELARVAHWWIPMQDVAIISERPIELHMKGDVLHNPDGPALLYADGYRLYALNGVRFSSDLAWCISLPREEVLARADEVLALRNAEQRAETVKRVGVAKFLGRLNPQVLDEKEGYQLLEVRLGAYAPRIYLKMQNPSVDETHIEPVHPDCRTVDEARSWRNWGTLSTNFTSPEVLT